MPGNEADARAGDESPPTARRWRRRKHARPQEIVAAAADLFVRHGYAATRMDDVARAAGVTAGTVYVYFGSKEALLNAVVYESVVPVLAFAQERLSRDGSAAELIRDLIEGFWTAVGDSRFGGIPRLMVAESSNFPGLARLYVEEVLERARRIFREAVARGVRTGEFRDVDVAQAAQVGMAPVQYAAIHAYSLAAYDPGFGDVRGYLEVHTELFLRGLAAERVR
jgi:AcrR family transcriptional regulator